MPYKPNSLLTDIAEYHNKSWHFVYWLVCSGSRQYKRSTMGHYYHCGWHPLAVAQRTYVIDDFGNLYLVYDDN